MVSPAPPRTLRPHRGERRGAAGSARHAGPAPGRRRPAGPGGGHGRARGAAAIGGARPRRGSGLKKARSEEKASGARARRAFSPGRLLFVSPSCERNFVPLLSPIPAPATRPRVGAAASARGRYGSGRPDAGARGMSHGPLRAPEPRANARSSPAARSSAAALLNRGRRRLPDLLRWPRALRQPSLPHEWLLRGSTW